MKKFILGFVMLFVLFGATAGSFADGGPIPMCNPDNPKGTQTKCQADSGHRGN